LNDRKNIAILFFTMVVVMLGFGIVIPIIPFYVESFGATGKDLGIMMAIFSIGQFIFSPIWGTLSDRIGRKPVLMIGAFGNGLSLLMMGLSTQFWMLLASRALAGILSSATLPTAMAYIGDSTEEKNRSAGMGIIGAAMGMGMVLGPGLGGWFASASLSTPFFFAAALSALSLIFIIVVLPESLPADKRVSGVQFRGPQLGEMWKSLFGPLGFLFFLAFIINFAMANFEGIFGLFTSHQYGYGPKDVGLIFTMIGLISAVVQGLATGPLTRRWGENKIILASLIASSVSFIMMLFAYNYATVMITVGLFVLSNSMLRPAVSSEISKKADQGQGAAMGLNNAFMSIGRIIGPLWAGYTFDINPNLPYISAAVVLLVSYFLSLKRLAPQKVSDYSLPVEPAQVVGDKLN